MGSASLRGVSSNSRKRWICRRNIAIGAFIQALGQNPGIESLLTELKEKAHVYVGTGLGSIGTAYTASITLYESQKRWDRFWSEPERNANLHAYLALPAEQQHLQADVPPLPESVSDDDRDAAQQAWNHYWMARSPELEEYLLELAAIEAGGVEGEVEAGKLHSIREKEKGRAKLQEKWQAPEPPWKVTPNFIWNIHNTPASQISILGKITGLAFAPVAACSTFGVTLRLAMRAIQTGDAKVVVMGATDPPPHPLTVGSFYSARVSSADRQVSVPLTDLRGTHVAGGSVVWILGDMEYMKSKGFKPLGMEPLGVGVSSDADHIITPSTQGPTTAILEASGRGGCDCRCGRHVGFTRHRHARRFFRNDHVPVYLLECGSGDGKKRHVRTRHERRWRMGAHSAILGPGTGASVPDAIDRR